MAKTSDLEKMSYAELAAMETRVGRLIIEKREVRARGAAREGDGAGTRARLRYQGADRPRQGTERNRGCEVSRSAEFREHVGRARADAALDGGGDEGRQDKEGGFSDRVAPVRRSTLERTALLALGAGARCSRCEHLAEARLGVWSSGAPPLGAGLRFLQHGVDHFTCLLGQAMPARLELLPPVGTAVPSGLPRPGGAQVAAGF